MNVKTTLSKLSATIKDHQEDIITGLIAVGGITASIFVAKVALQEAADYEKAVADSQKEYLEMYADAREYRRQQQTNI